MLNFVLTLAIISFILLVVYRIISANRHITNAKRLETEGKKDEALEAYKAAIVDNMKDFDAHAHIAFLYRENGDLHKAIYHLRKVLELDQYPIEFYKIDIHRALAELLFETGQEQAAYDEFFALFREYPHDYSVNTHLGEIYAGQNSLHPSLEFLNRAVSANPEEVRPHFVMGIVYAKLKMFNQAQDELIETKRLNVHYPNINLLLLMLMKNRLNYRKAIDIADKLLEGDNDPTREMITRRIKIMCQIMLEDFSPAENDINTYIAKAETFEMPEEKHTGHLDLAILFTKKLEFDSAIRYLKKIPDEFRDSTLRRRLYDYARHEVEINPDDDYTAVIENRRIDSYNNDLTEAQEQSEEERKRESQLKTISDFCQEWYNASFTENTMWETASLDSPHSITFQELNSDSDAEDESSQKTIGRYDIDSFLAIKNRREFKQLARKIASSMGYKIRAELPHVDKADFVEGVGIDYIAAHNDNPEKRVLLQLRNWGGRIGEIPLRNLTAVMGQNKCKKGLLIFGGELTQASQSKLEDLRSIDVIDKNDLTDILSSIK